MEKVISKRLINHIEVANSILKNDRIIRDIEKVVEVIVNSISDGGKLILFGNGGSASDAQHLATEFVSRFYKERSGFNAEALTVNTSILTAIANDYSFDKIFSRQVEAIGNEGDVVIGLSTSGNSENVIEAIKTAKEKNMICVGFTGGGTCCLDAVCDFVIHVPSNDTPRIQEMHILLGHIICEIVEERLCD